MASLISAAAFSELKNEEFAHNCIDTEDEGPAVPELAIIKQAKQKAKASLKKAVQGAAGSALKGAAASSERSGMEWAGMPMISLPDTASPSHPGTSPAALGMLLGHNRTSLPEDEDTSPVTYE